jgi:hypothetical protein
MLLVRSYRTFAPLPVKLNYGGMFLWHYPHDRSHWALPSRFGLSEARTFLEFDQQIRNHLAYFLFCLDYTGFPQWVAEPMLKHRSGNARAELVGYRSSYKNGLRLYL